MTAMNRFIYQFSDAQKALHAERAAALEKYEANRSIPCAMETFRSELRIAMLHFEQTLARRYEENHRPTFTGAAA